MKTSVMLKNRKSQHAFNGEVRIWINRRVYPHVDIDLVWELFQRFLDNNGVEPEGIKVELFDLRGEKIDSDDFALNDYSFVGVSDKIEGNKTGKTKS